MILRNLSWYIHFFKMSDFVAGESEVGNYKFIKKIGSGSFACVWLAIHKITEIKVAIKIVPKKSIEPGDSKNRFNREVSLLKQISHPFIAEFFEMVETDDYYFLVMEYVENGNMLDMINSNGRINEPQARRYFSQIICILEYLHKEKFVAHRDLKAENVLIDKYGNIRIIDFGLSNVFSKNNPQLSTACGSPAYAAPEMVKGQPYTNAADIWSAGILLYSMVAGKLPFDDPDTQRLLQKVVYTEVHYPPFFSSPLIDLLSKILIKDPENRLTLNGIKNHVWFSHSEYISLLQLKLKENHITSSIDKDIVDRIAKLGLDTKGLYESIMTNDFTEITAVYKMFCRKKMTEDMKDLMQKLYNNCYIQSPSIKFAYTFNQPTVIKRTDENSGQQNSCFKVSGRRQSQFVTTPLQTQMQEMIQGGFYPSKSISIKPNDIKNNSTVQTVENNSVPIPGMRMMQVPAPLQLATRRLSRPILKRTIDLPSSAK